MRKLNIIIPVVIIALIAALSSIYIVDEREKVLVLRFGQIKQVREEAGIGFKIPLLDEVVRYDDRILSLETPMIAGSRLMHLFCIVSPTCASSVRLWVSTAAVRLKSSSTVFWMVRSVRFSDRRV